MRRSVLVVLYCVVPLTCFGKDKQAESLTVRAIRHDVRVNQSTYTYTTPARSSTNCTGSGTTIGNTTTASTNCQTTSTPAQTQDITTQTADIVNVVEANGMRYVITCRAHWVGSNCSYMVDGSTFPAQIEGTTMWISAHKGGNQGKLIRVKYKILDIRPVESN
jgi:hypothetical protein